MKFTPQTYRIEDKPHIPFIDTAEINEILAAAIPDAVSVREVLTRSLAKQRLSLQDCALLVNTRDPQLRGEIKEAARQLKEKVYGKRIVLFAPLYVGSQCSNDCSYCGFRASNKEVLRHTLDAAELQQNVEALEDDGHKRVVLVFGEHPKYNPEFIADTVRAVYATKKGSGEIRRININAAPFGVEGFRKIAEAGIGTYQVFQETYHPDAYHQYHRSGRKSDYEFRLTAFDRAMEAGIDDVGIGVLVGLHDWRFELLGLVRHTNHLEACYNVGPHTISFPRLQEASQFGADQAHHVSDEDFALMVAILRLAVPYTGLILTARESYELRQEVLQYGCSQIDAGTNLELGGYARKKAGEEQDIRKEQFRIHDERSLNEVVDELIQQGYLPSFCTACYRMGRTGQHFMEFSVPGFIKKCCTPNALLTLAEYLEDYAPEATRSTGWDLIASEMAVSKGPADLEKRLQRIKEGERDLYY
jgi:2-iminoacetate synthase